MNGEVTALCAESYQSNFLCTALADNYTLKFMDIVNVTKDVQEGNKKNVIIYMANKPDIKDLYLLFNKIDSKHPSTSIIVLVKENSWFLNVLSECTGCFISGFIHAQRKRCSWLLKMFLKRR